MYSTDSRAASHAQKLRMPVEGYSRAPDMKQGTPEGTGTNGTLGTVQHTPSAFAGLLWRHGRGQENVKGSRKKGHNDCVKQESKITSDAVVMLMPSTALAESPCARLMEYGTTSPDKHEKVQISPDFIC